MSNYKSEAEIVALLDEYQARDRGGRSHNRQRLVRHTRARGQLNERQLNTSTQVLVIIEEKQREMQEMRRKLLSGEKSG